MAAAESYKTRINTGAPVGAKHTGFCADPGRLDVSRIVNHLVGQLAGHLVDHLVIQNTGHHVGHIVDHLIGHLVGHLVGNLVDLHAIWYTHISNDCVC